MLKYLLFITSISIFFCCQAQQLRTEITMYPSLMYNGTWDPAYEGTGLHLSYLHEYNNDQLAFGLNYDIAFWGYQLMSQVGYIKNGYTTESFQLDGEFSLLSGFLLTRPKPIFAYGGEVGMSGQYKISNRSSLCLFTGVNFIHAPTYNKYGGITNYLNTPIKLGWQVRLGEINE